MKTVLDPNKLVLMCAPCHKYEHARGKLARRIQKAKAGSVSKRILEAQLAALDERNAVPVISKRGSYDKTYKGNQLELRRQLETEDRIARLRAANRLLTEFGESR